MESVRQMLGCIYLALAHAGTEREMRVANGIIRDALDSGAVDDLYARNALLRLVRSAEAKPPSPPRKRSRRVGGK
jgi:hypothetical protein